MGLDQNALSLAPLRVLLRPRHWRHLNAAISAADQSGTGDGGVRAYLRDLHLPVGDLLLLTVAYSIWRGQGPALDVQKLWGTSPEVAAQLLAALAVAVDASAPDEILRKALLMVQPGPGVAEDSDFTGLSAVASES